MTDYADNNTYAPSPQRDRHVHVLWQVCRAPAGTAGQGGNDRTGTCRENGDSRVDAATLGMWCQSCCERYDACSCGSPRREITDTLPRKIAENGNFSKNFQKIFFAETLENIESAKKSERILTFFAEFRLPPIAKLLIRSYNRRYKEWGIYPLSKKNGSCECYQHLQKPDSKPIVTRFTAGLDCIRKGISCKRFIATKERTAL